jgi:hypothetical protein
MRRILPLTVIAFTVLAAFASADTLLFPKPLHLTREVVDPITGKTSHLEQYCLANRVVSIAGSRTVIADYDRSEVTEIDREKGTYSVTPFSTVASARPHRKVIRATATGTPASTTPAMEHRGTDRRAGRSVDLYAGDDAAHTLHAEIAVDQSAALSRDAFDVLVGAAYPGEGDASTELIRSASRRPVSGVSSNGAAVNGTSVNGTTVSESYGLPIEQTTRWDVNGRTITATNRVTRLSDDVAPSDLLAIPPGARRVDSRIVVNARESGQLDALPGKAHP